MVPSSLTIMRAFNQTLEECGAFEHLLIDNGKDFKSTWLAGSAWKERRIKRDRPYEQLVEGVFQEAGLELHFCNPYRGQSKPIERAFRTYIELFEKRMPTYVGSNTVMRPDEAKLYWGKINGRDKVEVTLTLTHLREIWPQFIRWYRAEWHHSGQGMDGKTPREVFEENMTVRRILPERYRMYIMTRREKRTVRRNGVAIGGIDYFTPQMIEYTGQEVEVRRGLDDIGTVHIFRLPERTYLFDAYNDILRDSGVSEDNNRRRNQATKAQRKIIKQYNQTKEEILRGRKRPDELLAEEAEADRRKNYPDDQLLQVVNGGPVLPDETVTPPADWLWSSPKNRPSGS